MSDKKRFLVAGAIAVALLATVAFARNVHTHALATHSTNGGAVSETTTPSPQHGMLACAPALAQECGKIRMLLPR